ncbi:hypothetical protein [Burkholderia sp. SCN-KJ]|uniref:hypothetical protein n=1 Tax=Burkholderia sp. SCN-KJ TaxID=2969248 RepID=UPI0021504479|nr:hypothetical protein [Burkholderia sp. SCN-KJ]MCR4471505.1 hypothetical protein [Burkholderia sp. SCN-KJ]
MADMVHWMPALRRRPNCTARYNRVFPLLAVSMPLPRTDFFDRVLQGPYDRLQASDLARLYLSGEFRLDGEVIGAETRIDFDGTELTSAEYAQLLMIFTDARVHEQAQYGVGPDAAPPGVYYTSVQPAILQHPHKNRIGLYEDVDDGMSLYFGEVDDDADDVMEPAIAQALHIDHVFLRHQAPDWLGTVAFALCAITAHRLGYRRITLIAGGGVGYDAHLIGYRYWPKLGFDGPLEGDECEIPAFRACRTVQDLLEIDEAWWGAHGSQRLMEFDLAADSRSWTKLLDYLLDKELI